MEAFLNLKPALNIRENIFKIMPLMLVCRQIQIHWTSGVNIFVTNFGHLNL